MTSLISSTPSPYATSLADHQSLLHSLSPTLFPLSHQLWSRTAAGITQQVKAVNFTPVIHIQPSVIAAIHHHLTNHAYEKTNTLTETNTYTNGGEEGQETEKSSSSISMVLAGDLVFSPTDKHFPVKLVVHQFYSSFSADRLLLLHTTARDNELLIRLHPSTMEHLLSTHKNPSTEVAAFTTTDYHDMISTLVTNMEAHTTHIPTLQQYIQIHSLLHVDHAYTQLTLHTEMFAPSVSLHYTPVPPLTIHPSTLLHSLYTETSSTSSGFLTMTHAQHIMLLAADDQQLIQSSPLLGIYVSGRAVTSIHTYLHCLRFLYSSHIQHRLTVAPLTFLLLLFSPDGSYTYYEASADVHEPSLAQYESSLQIQMPVQQGLEYVQVLTLVDEEKQQSIWKQVLDGEQQMNTQGVTVSIARNGELDGDAEHERVAAASFDSTNSVSSINSTMQTPSSASSTAMYNKSQLSILTTNRACTPDRLQSPSPLPASPPRPHMSSVTTTSKRQQQTLKTHKQPRAAKPSIHNPVKKRATTMQQKTVSADKRIPSRQVGQERTNVQEMAADAGGRKRRIPRSTPLKMKDNSNNNQATVVKRPIDQGNKINRVYPNSEKENTQRNQLFTCVSQDSSGQQVSVVCRSPVVRLDATRSECENEDRVFERQSLIKMRMEQKSRSKKRKDLLRRMQQHMTITQTQQQQPSHQQHEKNSNTITVHPSSASSSTTMDSSSLSPALLSLFAASLPSSVSVLDATILAQQFLQLLQQAAELTQTTPSAEKEATEVAYVTANEEREADKAALVAATVCTQSATPLIVSTAMIQSNADNMSTNKDSSFTQQHTQTQSQDVDEQEEEEKYPCSPLLSACHAHIPQTQSLDTDQHDTEGHTQPAQHHQITECEQQVRPSSPVILPSLQSSSHSLSNSSSDPIPLSPLLSSSNTTTSSDAEESSFLLSLSPTLAIRHLGALSPSTHLHSSSSSSSSSGLSVFMDIPRIRVHAHVLTDSEVDSDSEEQLLHKYEKKSSRYHHTKRQQQQYHYHRAHSTAHKSKSSKVQQQLPS